MSDDKYKLGMIGLGTMGRNLLLNMADHGFAVAGYDKDAPKVEALEKESEGLKVAAFAELQPFIDSLQSPRAIILLVPAGKIVDAVIEELVPLLSKGDIIIDSGNSHYRDTTTRVETLEKQGIHFFGMGISGGEEGARRGPSIMPGGDMTAYTFIQPVLEAVAAKVDGAPCVTYIGPGASGHFVKMVHNGIEYALMQLIADTYEVLKNGLKLDNDDIHKVFNDWNNGRLQSYLLEITSDIFTYKEKGADHSLVDDIKDEAKAKGTGKWTSQIAMDLELPVPTIDTAVSMRDLSKFKQLRTNMEALYPADETPLDGKVNDHLAALEEAFYFSMVNIYAQGMHMLQKGSTDNGFDLKLDEIAKIWRGGCIIRSKFLEVIYSAYSKNPQLKHLLADDAVQELIKKAAPSVRHVVAHVTLKGISIPAYSSALQYFDAIRTQRMPSNLIQAQRDYFGAHTYERTTQEGTFHTKWSEPVQ